MKEEEECKFIKRIAHLFYLFLLRHHMYLLVIYKKAYFYAVGLRFLSILTSSSKLVSQLMESSCTIFALLVSAEHTLWINETAATSSTPALVPAMSPSATIGNPILPNLYVFHNAKVFHGTVRPLIGTLVFPC